MLTIPNLARVNYWIFAVCLIAAVFSNPGSGHGAEREMVFGDGEGLGEGVADAHFAVALAGDAHAALLGLSRFGPEPGC